MNFINAFKKRIKKKKAIKKEATQIYKKLHKNRPLTSSPTRRELKDYEGIYKMVKKVRK